MLFTKLPRTAVTCYPSDRRLSPSFFLSLPHNHPPTLLNSLTNPFPPHTHTRTHTHTPTFKYPSITRPSTFVPSSFSIETSIDTNHACSCSKAHEAVFAFTAQPYARGFSYPSMYIPPNLSFAPRRAPVIASSPQSSLIIHCC